MGDEWNLFIGRKWRHCWTGKWKYSFLCWTSQGCFGQFRY